MIQNPPFDLTEREILDLHSALHLHSSHLFDVKSLKVVCFPFGTA